MPKERLRMSIKSVLEIMLMTLSPSNRCTKIQELISTIK